MSLASISIAAALTGRDGWGQEFEEACDYDEKPSLGFAPRGQDLRCNLKLGFAALEQGAGTARRAMNVASGQLCLVRSIGLRGGGVRRVPALPDELTRLRALRHPNLVRVLGFALERESLHICLEAAALKSLASFVAEFGPLKGRLLRRAVPGVLSGLSHLHGCQPAIAHGDLRGDNILVDRDFGVRLTNFGLSGLGAVAPAGIAPGALAWAAPEVVKGCQAVDHRKADMWSMGCTMVELCSGEPPHGRDASDDDIALALKGAAAAAPMMASGGVSPVMSPMPLGMQGLTRRCLRWAPAMRPSAHELAALFSRFVLGARDEDEEDDDEEDEEEEEEEWEWRQAQMEEEEEEPWSIASLN